MEVWRGDGVVSRVHSIILEVFSSSSLSFLSVAPNILKNNSDFRLKEFDRRDILGRFLDSLSEQPLPMLLSSSKQLICSRVCRL